jgi:hypothetical protein
VLSVHSAITECVGTPFYRSPEQEAEGVEYDHKVNHWIDRALSVRRD